MARRKTNRTPGVIGYVRVSTEEQASSGLGLRAQRSAIRAECNRRGLSLLVVHEDAGASAKTLDRPGMSAALDDLERGQGDVLMVAKLDRLTRSVHDATGLMDAAARAGWGLVALDINVDTTTPQGEVMANVMATFAQFERRLIGQRTRDALAAKKAQGVRLGRPRGMTDDVRQQIVASYLSGHGWTAIARELNAAEVPTAQGGSRWYPSTVRAVYASVEKPYPLHPGILGSHLAFLRESQKLSVTQAARKSGVRTSTWVAYETGEIGDHGDPDPDWLERVGDLLGGERWAATLLQAAGYTERAAEARASRRVGRGS